MFQRLTILLCLALIAACLPDGASSIEFDAGPIESGEFALITLAATHPRTSGDPTIKMAADALFIRYSAVELDDVSRALGAWTPASLEDECVVVAASQANTDFRATVDLLRAGEVGIAGNGDELTLTPRPIPSYFPQFRGAVYGTEEPGPPTYATGESYALWAAGSDEIGEFNLHLQAPPAVELVAINGRETGSASELALPEGDLSIELFSESDEVFVTIEDVSAISGPTIECRFRDLGTLDISEDDLEAVFGERPRLAVTARTVSGQPLPEAAGIEGRAQITFTDRVELVRISR